MNWLEMLITFVIIAYAFGIITPFLLKWVVMAYERYDNHRLALKFVEEYKTNPSTGIIQKYYENKSK